MICLDLGTSSGNHSARREKTVMDRFLGSLPLVEQKESLARQHLITCTVGRCDYLLLAIGLEDCDVSGNRWIHLRRDPTENLR